MSFHGNPLETGSRSGDLYIQGQLNSASQTIGGRIANAKMTALQRGRDFSSSVRRDVGSLQSLFPSSITGRLRNTGTVITKHVIKGFSHAFKTTKNHFTSEKVPEDQKGLHLLTAFHNGRPTASLEESKRAFNECLRGGFFDKFHSFKDINSPKGWASQVRDMYKLCQGERPSTVDNSQDQHFQSKLAKLQEHLSNLSPEDKAKFLSLGPEELLAIQLYTAEKDYRLINGMLNGEKWNLDTWIDAQGINIKDLDIEKVYKAFNNIIDLVSAAVDKLPQCEEKVVYRSVWMDQAKVDVYVKACDNKRKIYEIANKFVSTTKNKEVAENFDLSANHEGRVQVIYQIEPSEGHALNGADISLLSAKEGESEVLLKPNSAFVVTGYEKVPAGRDKEGRKHPEHWLIKLRQLPPGSVQEGPNV